MPISADPGWCIREWQPVAQDLTTAQNCTPVRWRRVWLLQTQLASAISDKTRLRHWRHSTSSAGKLTEWASEWAWLWLWRSMEVWPGWVVQGSWFHTKTVYCLLLCMQSHISILTIQYNAIYNIIYLFQTTRSIATQLRERNRQRGTKKTDYIETNRVVNFTTTAHCHYTWCR